MEAKLTVVSGKTTKDSVDLKLPATIGRSREAQLTVVHPMISRQHCQLFEADGLLMLRDLGSLNGTLVEGRRIIEAALRPDAEFTVGPLTFRVTYQYDGDPAAVPAPRFAEETPQPSTVDAGGEVPDFAALGEAPEVSPAEPSAGQAAAVQEPTATDREAVAAGAVAGEIEEAEVVEVAEVEEIEEVAAVETIEEIEEAEGEPQPTPPPEAPGPWAQKELRRKKAAAADEAARQSPAKPGAGKRPVGKQPAAQPARPAGKPGKPSKAENPEATIDFSIATGGPKKEPAADDIDDEFFKDFLKGLQ